MVTAVLTTSASSVYDDRPEERYHFPGRYLGIVRAAIGSWVIYYEPRRTSGLTSTSGRSAYFAIARLTAVTPDPARPDHHYAQIADYLEFDSPVPFRIGSRYFESALMKRDGSTNRGAFGWAVRTLEQAEFDAIVALGFAYQPKAWESVGRIEESATESTPHPIILQLTSRKFRDVTFRRQVREAYGNTCAVTGLRLTNGGGRPEVQAAHIRPVEFDGPDTVRNGLALTSTVHWMFDRGLIAVDDSMRLLVSGNGIPSELSSLVRPGSTLNVPNESFARPHPAYLRWHREQRFHP